MTKNTKPEIEVAEQLGESGPWTNTPPNTNPDWNIIGLTCKYNLQGIKDKISQTLEKQNSPAQPTPYTPNENPAWNWTPPKPAT